MSLRIRRLRSDDDLEALTSLIHRAYAPLAAAGLRYWGTHQSVDDTRARCGRGETWLAVLAGDGDVTRADRSERDADAERADAGGPVRRVVGTITLEPPELPRELPFYDQPHVATFHQFCVAPEHQGGGVGAALMDHAERRARELGARELALDTSEHAHGLIALYERRGYRHVGHADWRPKVNYRSVVLALRLDGAPPGSDCARPSSARRAAK